jgi:hypothetical protein
MFMTKNDDLLKFCIFETITYSLNQPCCGHLPCLECSNQSYWLEETPVHKLGHFDERNSLFVLATYQN